MKFCFLGKRALVIGSGGCIGHSIVVNLLKSGAKVIALEGTTATTRDDIPSFASLRTITPTDLCDWSQLELSLRDIGPIDYLLVNSTNEQVHNALVATNIKMLINITHVVLRDMLSRDTTGSIVNILPKSVDETAGAIHSFTRTWAAELKPHRIRVNEVDASESDEDEDSDEHTLIRTINEDDIVDEVLFLFSDSAKSITGHCVQLMLIDVEEGQCCGP